MGSLDSCDSQIGNTFVSRDRPEVPILLNPATRLIPRKGSFDGTSCTTEPWGVRPGGTIDNSPAIYRWVRDTN